MGMSVNPIALRKAKIVFNVGLSECNRVKFVDNSWRNLEWISMYF